MDSSSDSEFHFPFTGFQMDFDLVDVESYIDNLDFTLDTPTTYYPTNTDNDLLNAIDVRDVTSMIEDTSKYLPQGSRIPHIMSPTVEDYGREFDPSLSDYDGTAAFTPMYPTPSACSLSPESIDYSVSFSCLPCQSGFGGLSKIPQQQSTKEQMGSKSSSPSPPRILPRPSGQYPTELQQTSSLSINLNSYHPPIKTRLKKTANSPSDNATQQKGITKTCRCKVCSKEFARRKSLNRHYIVSHKSFAASIGLYVGRFPCTVQGCSKSYTRLDNLTRHLNNDH